MPENPKQENIPQKDQTKQEKTPDAPLDFEKLKDIGKGKKVLIVDDDPTTLELLKSSLTKFGFDVTSASNGKEAWQRLTPDSMPLLIVSDVMMPEMDGFKFFKELRQNNESKNIPVMILTARKKMEDSFLALGADAFISKPIDTNTFLKKVIELSLRAPKPKAVASPPSEKKDEKPQKKAESPAEE